MGNFDRNDRGGNRNGGFRGGNNRGGHQGFGGVNRGPVTMHKAICDKCHKSCEVPFRPSGDKPIYCNECFGGKKESGSHDNRGDRKDFSSFKQSRNFEGKNPKSFTQNNTSLNISEDIKKQLSEVNIKLDSLINILKDFSAPKVSAIKVSSSKVQGSRDMTKSSTKKISAKVIKKIVTKKNK